MENIDALSLALSAPSLGPCGPPASFATPVPEILEPHQILPCLHSLLISEISSNIALLCPTQPAFKAQLQSTSSRKPSLPAAPHAGLTLRRTGTGLGTGMLYQNSLTNGKGESPGILSGSWSRYPWAEGSELVIKGVGCGRTEEEAPSEQEQ